MLHGHIAAAVINRVVEESRVETAFQDAMRDAILRGSGWVKMGYHTESAPKFDEDVVVNSADEDVHRENEKLLINLPAEALKDEDHDKHIASHQALMDSPEIIVNLMQQFGEEADRLEQDEVGCIWEFVGDSLTPGVNYKWFQVWYGRGDAGKGTPACSRQAPITARATKTALGCACFSRS